MLHTYNLECLVLPGSVYLSSPYNNGLDIKQTTTFFVVVSFVLSLAGSAYVAIILELSLLLNARINVLPHHNS